jgi:hypothetical protein
MGGGPLVSGLLEGFQGYALFLAHCHTFAVWMEIMIRLSGAR